MKITGAQVFVGGPKKNYVTLKIMTDQGIYGLGDASLNNRETLPAVYLQDYLIPNLIGMDPRNSEDIWQFFYRGAYFRRGPIAMASDRLLPNDCAARFIQPSALPRGVSKPLSSTIWPSKWDRCL